jgi:hypothetical protein
MTRTTWVTRRKPVSYESVQSVSVRSRIGANLPMPTMSTTACTRPNAATAVSKRVLDLNLVTHVCGHGDDLGRELPGQFRVYVDDGHLRAGSVQCMCGVPTDALAGADDDRAASVEPSQRGEVG